MATEDTMENGWGVRYITHTERRCGRRSFAMFKADVAKAVPGFTLYSVQMCGTDANATAISLATDRDYKACLFGLGSYIGGDECHQFLSSSAYQIRCGLALPKEFDEASPLCQEQTAPLPYYVPSRFVCMEDQRLYEDRCLAHLHQRLLHAQLIGVPFRALFLEPILGGNGGELSHRFLVCLGQLLLHFRLRVVVDEVLTGGRIDGSIAMTPTLPATFRACVHSITMGKIVGCGLVLIRKEDKATESEEMLRGFSTQADCGLPSKLFHEVVQRIEAGMVKERRNKVLRLMSCSSPEKVEDHWGRGLLIYTTFSRANIKQGLRNRCLPRLERSKLRKNASTRTKWTRHSVSASLGAYTDQWIVRQRQRLFEGRYAFSAGLISYIFDRIETHNDGRNGDVVFRSEEVADFLGEKGKVMAQNYNVWQREAKGRKCNAKVLSLVKRAVTDSISNTKDSRTIYKKRMLNTRVEFNVFDATFLASTMEFTNG